MVGVGSHQDSVLGEEHAGSANPELEREPLAEVLDGPARCGRLNGGAREIEQQVELCLAPVGSVPGPRDAERDGDPFDALRSDVDLVRLDHEQAQRVVVSNQREEPARGEAAVGSRSEEHTPELQSLKRNSYAVYCLKKKRKNTTR